MPTKRKTSSASRPRSDSKRYMLQNTRGEDVLGGAVSGDNVFIRTYGSLVKGHSAVSALAVGETTKKAYSLSGQKKTIYTIVRVK